MSPDSASRTGPQDQKARSGRRAFSVAIGTVSIAAAGISPTAASSEGPRILVKEGDYFSSSFKTYIWSPSDAYGTKRVSIKGPGTTRSWSRNSGSLALKPGRYVGRRVIDRSTIRWSALNNAERHKLTVLLTGSSSITRTSTATSREWDATLDPDKGVAYEHSGWPTSIPTDLPDGAEYLGAITCLSPYKWDPDWYSFNERWAIHKESPEVWEVSQPSAWVQASNGTWTPGPESGRPCEIATRPGTLDSLAGMGRPSGAVYHVIQLPDGNFTTRTVTTPIEYTWSGKVTVIDRFGNRYETWARQVSDTPFEPNVNKVFHGKLRITKAVTKNLTPAVTKHFTVRARNNPGASLREGAEIKVGMTRAQVARIVGSDGQAQMTPPGEPLKVRIYYYENLTLPPLKVAYVNGIATVVRQYLP